MYDAIVIGARCAGSPTAMLLARRGYRVLLVDRATFPSDTLSTHYIHQSGTSRLQRWGLLEKVAASGCPPHHEQSLAFEAFAIRGSPPPLDGVATAYAPRRTVLDTILVEAAAAAGVEVRERFSVTELVRDGDRITGVRGHSAGGPTVTEHARIVVGADGLHSLIARSVHAPTYNERPSFTCAYYSYWSGMETHAIELYARPGNMFAAGSTNDGQTMVIVYWPLDQFSRVRSDIESSFLAALDRAPDLASRVREGERTEPFKGSADLRNVFRKPYGPGWALVGDAGYHKDPITAQGISDAFRDAELLAEAIDDGFSGRMPLMTALERYEQRRNDAALPIYEMTCQLATLEPPPPEMEMVFRALANNPRESNRFFGTLAGTVPMGDFFAPENLRRIVDQGNVHAA